MQRKMGRFARYRVALKTAVTRVDDLHQADCNRSTAYVLQYYVLYFQLYWSNDVELATIFRTLSDHPSYIVGLKVQFIYIYTFILYVYFKL